MFFFLQDHFHKQKKNTIDFSSLKKKKILFEPTSPGPTPNGYFPIYPNLKKNWAF